jgi:predicted RNA-binding Zn-ribbon protein involved in translation (DUF1610 family)
MSDPTGKPAARPLSSAERATLFAARDRLLHPRPAAHERARRHRACPDCGNPTVWRHFRYGPRGADYCPNCRWEEAPC